MLGLALRLSDAGARYIVVMGQQDFGLAPGPIANGESAAVTARVQAYNDALFSAPVAGAARIIAIDLLTFSRELHAEAAAFGFTNVTGTACQPQITANSLTCNPTSNISPDARNAYLYADGIHYTPRAHDIISQFVISVLEAPRLIAQLPQGLAANGIARVDRVLALQGFGQQPEHGWWVDARGEVQGIGAQDGGTGLGADVLGGYNFDAGSVRIGIFAGYGTSTQDFASGGGYDQSDLSLGVHATWTRENGWFQLQASFTDSGFDVERLVNLAGRDTIGLVPNSPDELNEDGIGYFEVTDQTRGGVTRRHEGRADGKMLTIGASGGWQFTSGKVSHGPVGSFLAQFITVDGFTESNAELATALGYPEQEVTALTARLGWQAAWEVSGPLAPYARVMYQHQSTNADEAFARSLTLSETDYFAVPGADPESNFVTATLGMQGELEGMRTDFGATAKIGNGDGVALSALAGISKSF